MSFPDREFLAMLERFQRETSKSWPDVLRQQGRLIAVNLAHNTQPYGFGEKARLLGEGAVLRDVGRVFWSFATTYAQLRERSEKAARAFYSAAINGKFKRAEKILEASGIDVPIGTIKASMHQARRDRRGRVRGKKPAMIARNDKSLQKYSQRIVKRVGFGKSGFAGIAKELGGMRGIPHWAKRGRGPGTVEDHSRDVNNPSITMKNNVNYIRQICRDSAVQAALRLQREKMVKHMERVVTEAGRHAGMEGG